MGRAFVLGKGAEHKLPHLAGQVLVLRKVAEPQVAGPGGAAGVQFGRTGERLEQRRLARAVAPDDADPVADGHPERYAVQQHPRPVGPRGRLQRDQRSERRGAQAHRRSAATTAAPAAGPLTWTPARQTPALVSQTASSPARPASAARNAPAGPEPGTIAPSAPCPPPPVRRPRPP